MLAIYSRSYGTRTPLEITSTGAIDTHPISADRPLCTGIEVIAGTVRYSR
jgi:hypothetical protein